MKLILIFSWQGIIFVNYAHTCKITKTNFNLSYTQTLEFYCRPITQLTWTSLKDNATFIKALMFLFIMDRDSKSNFNCHIKLLLYFSVENTNGFIITSTNLNEIVGNYLFHPSRKCHCSQNLQTAEVAQHIITVHRDNTISQNQILYY